MVNLEVPVMTSMILVETLTMVVAMLTVTMVTPTMNMMNLEVMVAALAVAGRMAKMALTEVMMGTLVASIGARDGVSSVARN